LRGPPTAHLRKDTTRYLIVGQPFSSFRILNPAQSIFCSSRDCRALIISSERVLHCHPERGITFLSSEDISGTSSTALAGKCNSRLLNSIPSLLPAVRPHHHLSELRYETRRSRLPTSQLEAIFCSNKTIRPNPPSLYITAKLQCAHGGEPLLLAGNSPCLSRPIT
jgi:hypothetical protein